MIAVVLVSISGLTATPTDASGIPDTKIETHLDHSSGDGFPHTGHSEKCHILKHLTLRTHNEVIKVWQTIVQQEVTSEVIIGHQTIPLFRPPIS